MGTWTSGYAEFHDTPDGEDWRPSPPARPQFPCPECALVFVDEANLQYHQWEDHRLQRPVLTFRGRECGRTRLVITQHAQPYDWDYRFADTIEINGQRFAPDDALRALANKRSEVVEVALLNHTRRQSYEFDFALASDDDLCRIDALLGEFLAERALNRRGIEEFADRASRFSTGRRYSSAITSYLYGALAREDQAPWDYREKYDSAVNTLKDYDREPAEAICGLVAFHYNHFARAMYKTRSRRVAEVSQRFYGVLEGKDWWPGDFSQQQHSGLDRALSDSAVERVLSISAHAFDGKNSSLLAKIESLLLEARPYDDLKLRLVAAESYFALGDLASAKKHADQLRRQEHASIWYDGFRQRTKDREATA